MGAAKRLVNILSRRVVFLDGAMGTMLMKSGMPPGACPERWAAENPGKLEDIHKNYVLAGSDVVLSCTFGGTRSRLGESPERMNSVLARCLLKAVDGRAIPAASMGPTGILMHPLGGLRWMDAYNEFHAQAKALVEAGLEVFFLETFSDPRELKAAVLAVRDACPHGFISAQMSFGEDGFSLTGTSAKALAAFAQQLPANAVGANCSVGPDSLASVVKAIRAHTSKHVSIEPNAGMPDSSGRHNMPPEAFASRCDDLVWSGASIIGGCCGTGPEHIQALRALVGKRKRERTPGTLPRLLTSMTSVVSLGGELVVVGESINPTGRNGLKDAIRAGDTGYVLSAAAGQPAARVLDINLGLERMIPDGFVTDLFAGLSTGPPISVDLSDPWNIELAFRELGGAGILNSLTCDPDFIGKRVGTLLRHGGYAVLLPMGPDGIPESPVDRVAMIKRGMSVLSEHGFPEWRVIADPVVQSLASGADPAVTLKTLAMMKKRRWLTIAGVSNVSHGLPGRRAVNMAFLSRLAEGGLDLAIVDATRPETRLAVRGGQVLGGRVSAVEDMELPDDSTTPAGSIQEAILRGDVRETLGQAERLLARGTDPSDLIDEHLQKAMAKLGRLYEEKKAFLPHLIAAAEAARALTELLRPLLKTGREKSRGSVVLATVKGDIHDIGKNLVALFLEGAGYDVIDLGRDVPALRIVEAVRETGANAVALSALMSSTASRMEEVVGLLRESGLRTPVIIGGAVVTREFAVQIGALYSREAFGVVKTLEEVLHSLE
ncbi:MAG: homocysteine S-methyltransferase family protein [Candidatus Fermentibacteraceae bacterium]